MEFLCNIYQYIPIDVYANSNVFSNVLDIPKSPSLTLHNIYNFTIPLLQRNIFYNFISLCNIFN